MKIKEKMKRGKYRGWIIQPYLVEYSSGETVDYDIIDKEGIPRKSVDTLEQAYLWIDEKISSEK